VAQSFYTITTAKGLGTSRLHSPALPSKEWDLSYSPAYRYRLAWRRTTRCHSKQ